MNENKRRRRDRRQEVDKPLHLQERDVDVVEAVATHKALTTQQLQLLFFGEANKSGAQRRLEKLYDHGYLDRIFLPVERGAGRSPTLYILDKKGAELVRRERDPELKWYPSNKNIGSDFLEHTYGINQVMVAVAVACQKANYTLDFWLTERQVKESYDYVTITTAREKPRKLPIVPDAIFAIIADNRRFHFFLELDRATMPLKRFKSKIRAYTTYHQSGAYQKRFQTNSLRVLTVVESKSSIGEKRLPNLKQATEEAGGQRRFWFTLLKDVTPQSVLTAPIWAKATQKGGFSLFETTEIDQEEGR
jgi:hypothetical protein